MVCSRLQELEYGPGEIYAGCPSSRGFGVAAQSYSNFLASTVSAVNVPCKAVAKMCAGVGGSDLLGVSSDMQVNHTS